MKLKKNSSEQKLRGAYYTPLNLAKKTIDFFNNDENINNILEPSCGDGVFIDALLNSSLQNKNITAIEIEKKETDKLQQKFLNQKNIYIKNSDFFNYFEQIKNTSKFDLIIGNPPYIRYQYLTELQREEMSNLLIEHNMKSNKLINTWVAFTVACVSLLSENGKIAFVIPAELLQVAYSEDLRKFLSISLDNITLLAFDELIFPDIEQEVVVLIGEKKSDSKGIKIIEQKNIEDINIENIKNEEFQNLENTKEKWTQYFINKSENAFIKSIRNNPKFQKLSATALINVGVTTGDNKYFSVNEETATKYDLKNISLPLIGKSSHVNSVFFEKYDWQKNINKKKNAYLVNFPNMPITNYSQKQQDYIAFGIQSGINNGYKCGIRECWYQIPSIWIPDAFFLRRNNLYPKFVLNRCSAISTDTMHRIKFNKGIEPERIILSYYNSISFAFTELCGRSYGGGVLEILPSEVGNIFVPKLENIPIEKIQEVLKKVDAMIRDNKDIEDVLNLVDEEILINLIGETKENCVLARSIWKKMQTRRLGR